VLAAPPPVVPVKPAEPPRAPDPAPPPAPVPEPVRTKPARVTKKHRPAPVATPEPACDADAFAKTGQAAYVAGNYSTALRAFESALECRPSQSTAAKVAMAACRAGDASKAQQAWRALTPQSKKLVEPICAQGGIVFDPPPVT
jgi:hypothetical protein